jgi:hypothetical protein
MIFMNVNLHIERLILDGLPFEARQRAALQTQIEIELARLLTENGVAPNWQSGGAVPSLRADAIQITAESNAEQLGRQIAGSIYGSIGKTV